MNSKSNCGHISPIFSSSTMPTYVEKFMRQRGNLVQIIQQRCRILSKAGETMTDVSTGSDEDGGQGQGGVGGVQGQGHHLVTHHGQGQDVSQGHPLGGDHLCLGVVGLHRPGWYSAVQRNEGHLNWNEARCYNDHGMDL